MSIEQIKIPTTTNTPTKKYIYRKRLNVFLL